MLEFARVGSAEKDESPCGRAKGATLSQYHCVEMKPVKALPIYQFKLFPRPNGREAVLFVKPDSQIIEYLKSDSVFEMTFLPKHPHTGHRSLPTLIKSVSRQHRGPFRGHLKVGISIGDDQ